MHLYIPCPFSFTSVYCACVGNLIEGNIISQITEMLGDISVVLISDLGSDLGLSIVHFRDICYILG